MALLQVHQAKALKDLHEGVHDLAVLHKLRAVMDLALRATKVTAQSLCSLCLCVPVWLSGRALRQQRKRLWVRFPGNTCTEKKSIT